MLRIQLSVFTQLYFNTDFSLFATFTVIKNMFGFTPTQIGNHSELEHMINMIKPWENDALDTWLDRLQQNIYSFYCLWSFKQKEDKYLKPHSATEYEAL